MLDLLRFRIGEIFHLKNSVRTLKEKQSYPFLFCSEREASERKKNDEEKSSAKPSDDAKVIS